MAASVGHCHDECPLAGAVSGRRGSISLKNAVFSDAVLPPSFNGKGIDE
jgi:hypothetical protein